MVQMIRVFPSQHLSEEAGELEGGDLALPAPCASGQEAGPLA